MRIGYARVSRVKQNLDLQTDELAAAGAEQIFTDTVSGATVRREGLTRLLEIAREGDQVIVWRIDRLGRSLKDLIAIAGEFERRKINLVSLKENIDTTSVTGRLFFNLFGAIAEWERAWIRERTRAGLEAARRRGRGGGRKPSLTVEGVAAAEKMLADGKTPKQVARILHCSERTIRRVQSGEHALSFGT